MNLNNEVQERSVLFGRSEAKAIDPVTGATHFAVRPNQSSRSRREGVAQSRLLPPGLRVRGLASEQNCQGYKTRVPEGMSILASLRISLFQRLLIPLTIYSHLFLYYSINAAALQSGSSRIGVRGAMIASRGRIPVWNIEAACWLRKWDHGPARGEVNESSSL
jgi:hypothetical protein